MKTKLISTKQLFRNRIIAAAGMVASAVFIAVYAVCAREYWFLIPAVLGALGAASAFQLTFESRRYDPK